MAGPRAAPVRRSRRGCERVPRYGGSLFTYVAPLLSTTMFAKLACGKVNECPFRGLEELGEKVYRKAERAGERPRRKPEKNRSPLEFRLLTAILKQTGDPERVLSSFNQGVRVGKSGSTCSGSQQPSLAGGAGN